MKKSQGKAIIKSILTLLEADVSYELGQYSVAVEDNGLGLRIRTAGERSSTTFYNTHVIALIEGLPVNQYITVDDIGVVLKVYVVARR